MAMAIRIIMEIMEAIRMATGMEIMPIRTRVIPIRETVTVIQAMEATATGITMAETTRIMGATIPTTGTMAVMIATGIAAMAMAAMRLRRPRQRFPLPIFQ